MNASMIHHRSHVLSSVFIALSFVLVGLLSAFSSPASASVLHVTTTQSDLVDLTGTPPVTPSLASIHSPSSHGVFTVSGTGFTPGGRVYIAIYDQAGARLYENRWVHAESRTRDDAGGEVVASFTGLCGASAMTRALDGVTKTWTNWLTAEPNCLAADVAAVANKTGQSFSLPVAGSSNASFSVAAARSAASAKAAPLLLVSSDDQESPGAVKVSGVGFTPNGKVYIAFYDAMGAKLYATRWVTTTPYYHVSGMTSAGFTGGSVQAVAEGVFSQLFPHYCGADVMLRAYDQGTQTWSNWITLPSNCVNRSGSNHDESASKVG